MKGKQTGRGKQNQKRKGNPSGPPNARQLKKIARNRARRIKFKATNLQPNRPKGGNPKQLVDITNDSRASKSSASQIMAPGVSNVINEVYQVVSTALQGASYAYICAAIQRGWLANAAQPDYPYAAWQYMAGVWGAFINGTVPQGTTLPYWMWALGRAVSSKTVPKGKGEVYYKGEVGIAVPSTPSYPLGPIAYGYEGNLWIPAGTETDLFPNAVAPGTPTDQAQAFLALCGFMASHGNPSISKMWDSTVKTSLDRDVSAFSTVLDVVGFGNNTNGGAAYLAALEVFVHHPLLSPALPQVANSLTGSPVRFSARTNAWGGDDLFMANCMSNIIPQSFWKSKIAPKFKFIDFREFQEVVAMWASKIVSQYWTDPSLAIASLGVGDQLPATTVCPLTLQEMGLVLRNEILFMFGPTQNGVQSLLPILPTGAGDKQFMPYLTGNTGSAVQSFKMKLPLPLVENLRALILHVVATASGKDHELLYPVIGQYYGDDLVYTDYTFTTTDSLGATTQTPTFAALPAIQRRARSSSKSSDVKWTKTMVETIIDFVDTSNGTAYVFINDPGRLTQLTTLWNEWVGKFQSYSSPVSEVSLDPGVNVLTSINQTRYWANESTAFKARMLDVRDDRIESRRALATTVYATRQAFAVSYREAPLADTQKITTMWILPVSYLQVGSASPNASSFVRIQAVNSEEFSTTTSTTGDTGTTMSTLHSIFADSMVHGKDTESSFDAELRSLTTSGKAGILSSLVASWAGQTFGTTVGAIASTIADCLPI